MQGDVVSASRWLGGSILLASLIMVVGFRGVRPAEFRTRLSAPLKADSAEAIPSTKLDPSVVQATTEGSSTPTHDITRCFRSEDEDRIKIVDPGESTCLDRPSEAEVWDKIPKFKGGSPVLYETQRNNVRLVIEKIGQKVDPCKDFPLAGRCELIHCHYKCTVNFDEEVSEGTTLSPLTHKHRVEIVYIDKDYLRRCSGPADSQPAP